MRVVPVQVIWGSASSLIDETPSFIPYTSAITILLIHPVPKLFVLIRWLPNPPYRSAIAILLVGYWPRLFALINATPELFLLIRATSVFILIRYWPLPSLYIPDQGCSSCNDETSVFVLIRWLSVFSVLIPYQNYSSLKGGYRYPPYRSLTVISLSNPWSVSSLLMRHRSAIPVSLYSSLCIWLC